jgi:SAM-dependent methyltransferase
MGTLRARFRQMVPSPLRSVLRRGRDRLLDIFDSVRGARDPLTPPRRLIFVGGDKGNFKELGEKWVETLVRLGGLQPGHRVLDLGCGVGRMAVPLTRRLSSQGSYEGLDIVSEGIEWCAKTLTPRHANFRFQVADVYNRYYNPKGSFEPSKYRLPYPDDEFDFAFLTSVFTHMRPPEVENYLSEVRRVLKPGARCLITFFLLTGDSLRRIENKEVQPGRDFVHDIGGCRTSDPAMPEDAIAYEESAVLAMFERSGLAITDIQHGAWCGAKDAHHGQDIVVALKS